MSTKTMIAMSGGVDSGATAYLCKSAGHDCIGATMSLFRENDNSNAGDIADARKIADALGFPFIVMDLAEQFEKQVIARFIESYEKGDTPNPCIFCNNHLKFGIMLDEALKMGCDKLATGHYARIEQVGDRYLLKKGADITKDQSYVLYGLTQYQLSHLLFPVGDYSKDEIRRIAEENGLVNARKKDSQDICFVPDGDYAAFICRYTGKTYPDGDFVNLNGDVLGIHKGIIKYTTGQRKGLGLALPAPMYVCKKDMENNKVILCSNDELFSSRLVATDFNWIACDCPTAPIRAGVRIRYNQAEQPATIIPTSPNSVVIEFDSPQRAITTGQSAVVYDGDIVVGGGIIAE